MSKDYGFYKWIIQKEEVKKAKVELDGEIAELELQNEVAQKQHDAILRDIEDTEKLRPIDRAIESTDRALKCLKKLEQLKEAQADLESLGVDVTAMLNKQQQLIASCFA